MNPSDLENGINEREALTTDERRIADLLGALPRAEAPSNFEFGMKARIAADDAGSRASLIPFLKVAAPLTLVLLVAAFVIFYAALPTDSRIDPVAEVAGPAPIRNSEPETAATVAPSVTAPEPRAAEPARDDRVAAPVFAGPVRRAPKRQAANTAPGGGSFVQSYGVANVRTPRGFEPVTPTRNANAAIGAREIPVQEMFEMLGVKAEFVSGGWTVRSTAANSVAARAGLQADDVIEAINDQDVSEKTKFKSGVEGKSLSIRRKTNQLKLDLRKK